MHWKEQLKAAVENDWKNGKKTLVIPGRFYRYVPLKVHNDLASEDDFLLWRPAIGHANDREFCGAYQGKLLFLDYQYALTGADFTFGLKTSGGWNEDDETWPYFDFDSLP
jgi:hypothetical protein